MLAFLTIGYGVCTNSVVMAAGITLATTPGNLSSGPTWAGTALQNRAQSGKPSLFGAQRANTFGTGSKKAQHSTKAASRTITSQHRKGI